MTDDRTIPPEDLIAAKPADFDGTTGYAIFTGFVPGDLRFVCGVVPADGKEIEDAARHVKRAWQWADENPEDPRVEALDFCRRLWHRKRRALRALRETTGGTSKIVVSALVPVWRSLDSGAGFDGWIEDETSESEVLDRMDAWVATDDDDDDESADSAQEAENSTLYVEHTAAQEGAAQ